MCVTFNYDIQGSITIFMKKENYTLKKFTTTFRRLNAQEAPLNRGSTGLVFEEVEEGKTFCELITDILDTGTDIQKTSFCEKLLKLHYPIVLTIKKDSENSDELKETLDDIRLGLKYLDGASTSFRESIATNEMELAKARALHIYTVLNVNGIFDFTDLGLDFDSVNLQLDSLKPEEVEKGLITLMSYFQRQGPTTYVISKEMESTITGEGKVASWFKDLSETRKSIFCENPDYETVRTI